MKSRFFRKRAEDGATLILVLGFMLMVGLVSAGLATQLASSSQSRVALNTARNREYAADAAILADMAQVRSNMETNQALAPCPGTKLVQNPGLNGVAVQVDCSYTRTITLSGFVQRNATFTACPLQAGTAACPANDVIIQAQVNYESQGAPNDADIDVTKTYIQTWNVKS